MLGFLVWLGAIGSGISVAYTIYKVGNWTGGVTQSVKELTEQQKQFNNAFAQYVIDMDNKLTEVKDRINVIEQKVK